MRTCRSTLGPPPCICSSSRVARLTITIIILSNKLIQLRIYYQGQRAFQARKADDTEGTRLVSSLGEPIEAQDSLHLACSRNKRYNIKKLSYQLIYFTIIPRLCVGFEMVDHLISNQRQCNNFFIKTLTKYREFFPTLFKKTADIQLVSNFEQTRTVTLFGEYGIMPHIPWWLSQSEL